MKELLLVAVGGAIGSVARYLAGIAIIRVMGAAFPFNTLFVNVVGSFIMGVVIAALVKIDPPQAYVTHVRLFVAVGLLGGFTTFSSFSADVVALWESASYAECAQYMAASMVLSIVALFLGLYLIRRFAG
jgi:CrcB protein